MEEFLGLRKDKYMRAKEIQIWKYSYVKIAMGQDSFFWKILKSQLRMNYDDGLHGMREKSYASPLIRECHIFSVFRPSVHSFIQ